MKRAHAVVLALTIFAATTFAAAQRFYEDDPIQREPETRDAAGAMPWDIDLTWDLAYNLFANPAGASADVRAQNVNTIDEVPDSNWFTNRILAKPISAEVAANGPIDGTGPAPGRWTIVRPKQAGTAPGFTMRDSRGDVWFVSFDAKGYPEAATGAIMVANKIFWTLGYWQVENHLVSVSSENVTIGENVMIRVESGERRPMRQSDLDAVLERAERSPDGSYRAIAGKEIPGKILGGFKYFGVRPDDPNDVVPHEHRRELRGLKVFGAWTNLVDMKAGNTVDTIIQDNGKNVVRHYLQDVGSTFGTVSTAVREYDEGSEYLYEGATLLKRLFTFGFFIRPWQTVDYENHPSVGRFEANIFDPVEWKPRVPTAAFLLARPDDNFWAARRVMAFSDDMIRAIAKTGRFSSPVAEKFLADTLIARRDKIGRAFLPAVNPLVDFALNDSAGLTFVNAAVAARIAASPAEGYSASWSAFDNVTGESRLLGANTASRNETISAPPNLPSADGSYIKVQVNAVNPAIRAWAVPMDVYFRRVAGNWKLVGLERMR
jgi:hypothetical protein